MNDIIRAKELLISGGYTCVLIKGTATYTSTERGVAPLLKFIDSSVDFSSFCAADKVVGKAAALLYVYMGIKRLYAKTISTGAVNILKKYHIAYQYENLTPYIMNRNGDGICPMEKAVEHTENPEESLLLIKEKLSSLKAAT